MPLPDSSKASVSAVLRNPTANHKDNTMTQDEFETLPDVTPGIVEHRSAGSRVVIPVLEGGFTGVLWKDATDGECMFRGVCYETGWHKGVHVKRRSPHWSSK